jgi:hypothetical protein
LTLDDDVAAQLQQARAREGVPFKQLVNDALRAGLTRREQEQPERRGPYTRAVRLGEPRLADLDDVSEVLAVVEGEGQR